MPVFDRTLLLRQGEVAGSGLTEEVMGEKVLSDFFQAPVAVERYDGRVYVRPGG